MKTISKYAFENGIKYRAAWNRYKKGLIPGAFKDKFGKILIPDDAPNKPVKAVVYCRVSSSQNKANLDTQAERVVSYANAIGLPVAQIVKECGSGLNDTRTKLCRILRDVDITHILVEHKDRLTRFGFNYLQLLSESRQFKIVVVNTVDTDKADLMQDFVSLVTSFCARLYGLRRSKRHAVKIIEDCKP